MAALRGEGGGPFLMSIIRWVLVVVVVYVSNKILRKETYLGPMRRQQRLIGPFFCYFCCPLGVLGRVRHPGGWVVDHWWLFVASSHPGLGGNVAFRRGDVGWWWYGMTNVVGTNVELIYLVICARTLFRVGFFNLTKKCKKKCVMYLL